MVWLPTRTAPLVFVLLVVSVMAGGCDGVSSFDRSNPKDPESEAFIPRPGSTLVATPKQDGTVLLRWPDASTLTDGHLIEKSVGDKNSFEPLATVAGSDSTYQDTTREFGQPTYYRHRPFVERDGERTFSEAEEAKLAFGSIESFRVETDPDGTFHLSWADSSRLERGYRIEVSVDGSSFQEIATLARNRESYSYRPSPLSFAEESRAYRVMAPLLGADTTNVGTASRRLSVRERFAPADVSANILDEATVKMNWDTRVSFADHQRVIHVPEFGDTTTVTLGPDAESYTFEETLQLWGHRYLVAAVDEDGNRSEANSVHKEFRVESPSLTIASDENPPDGVNLSWSHPAPDRVAGFTLMRTAVRSGGRKIFNLSEDVRSYVDSEIDPDSAYRYKIRTKASRNSNGHMALYSQDYQRAYTVAEACGEKFGPYFFPSPRGITVSPDGFTIAASADTAVSMINFNTGEVENCVSEHTEDYYDYESVSFNPDGSLLAIGAASSSGQALLWERASASVAHRLGFGGGVFTTAFSSSGKFFGVAGARGRLAVWRTSTGEKKWSTPKQIRSPYVSSWAISFDASEQIVATGTAHGGLNRVVLRDVGTGSVQRKIPLDHGVYEMRFAQPASEEVLVIANTDPEVIVLNPENGNHAVSIPGANVAVSQEETRMVSQLPDNLNNRNGEAQLLWSLPEAKPLGVIPGTPRARALTLSPDGQEVVAWTEEGIIRWTAKSGTRRWRATY